MTLISTSSIFQPNNKSIKFNNSDIVVTSGANNIAKLDLCGINVKYAQYQQLSLQIPAGSTDYLLDFSVMGLKITFVSIKPKFCANCDDCKYIKWKFQLSNDPKLSMTSIMILTGTVANPVPNITIDNPSLDCPLQIDILVGAMENDGLSDTNAFLYLNNLSFSDIHTYNNTNSGILEFYNNLGDLAGSVNISDIVNISRVANTNRIIIDEASSENIVLDFISTNDTLQALSALNWLLLDAANRSLPQPADVTSPTIVLSNRVVGGMMNIDLSTFSNNYTKLNLITDAIDSIIDNRDGIIIANPNNVIIKQNGVDYPNITNSGLYNITINISDIAGNLTTTIFNITAQAVIVDIIPPVIIHTPNVIGTNINTIDLSTYPLQQFTYNDAKLLCILSVSDNIDGIIGLNNVSVIFRDINNTTISSPITQEGNYTITFSVADSHSNIFTENLTINIINSIVDSGPQIQFTSFVNGISMSSNISLSNNYGSGIGVFTKSNSLSYMIQNVTDDIDGIMVLTTSNVTFYNNLNVNIPTISLPGTYNVVFSVTDSGLNITTKTITLIVTL